ncbi:MAG: ABC transporter permease [Solirubrobacteraceae bacterium]
MNRLIRAEALKLRSTRSACVAAVGVLALIAIAAAAVSAAASFHPGDHPGRDALGLTGIAQTFALLLGVTAVTSEFRHGTITAALLITPRRTPLLTAKLANLALAGLAFGLVAFTAAAAIALPILSQRGIASQLDPGNVAGIIAGGAVATALFAALGVGVGTIVRNQVAAIITALGFLYAVEPILTFIPAVGDAVQNYGLGGLSSGASGTTAFQPNLHTLGQAPALLVLAAYALVVLLAGTALFGRRDVSG